MISNLKAAVLRFPMLAPGRGLASKFRDPTVVGFNPGVPLRSELPMLNFCLFLALLVIARESSYGRTLILAVQDRVLLLSKALLHRAIHLRYLHKLRTKALTTFQTDLGALVDETCVLACRGGA